MNKYERLQRECDAAIKAGRTQQAAAKLRKIVASRVPRAHRLPLASLCRRAGLYVMGAKILTPSVKPLDRAIESLPHGRELAEYGVLLHRLGANSDALRILDLLDDNQIVERELYRAFCLMQDWRHREASEALTKFVANQTDPYQNLVGRVNLALAMLMGQRLIEATDVIRENSEIAIRRGHARLAANCDWMMGMVHLHREEVGLAQAAFTSAASKLDLGTHDGYLIRFGRTLAGAIEKRSPSEIVSLRDEAARLSKWELSREADLFLLMVEFDEDRLRHLYLGSPFAAFREILAKRFGRVPEGELIIGDKGAPQIDLVAGQWGKWSEPFGYGSKPHHLAFLANRDLYRPQRTGELFSKLFPGEYFNIHSSPNRVHQLAFRTRESLRESGIPIDLASNEGHYQLALGQGLSLIHQNESESLHPTGRALRLLEKEFPQGGPFTAKSARDKLGMSRSSFHRLLQKAIGEGLVQSSGREDQVVYSLNSTNKAA